MDCLPRLSNGNFLRATSRKIQGGVALRFPPHSKTLARSPTAMLQTLLLLHVRRFGLRRQSSAATALWIASHGCESATSLRATSRNIQSGVALRFPPHSKTLARSRTAR